MILNIRGSSCSGKSTNVYSLLRDYPSVEVWERVGWNKKKPRQVGHLLPGGLFVVGPYAATAKTGGMDMLMPGKTELVTLWLERNCLRYPHVIFESMMASLAIGRYHELPKRLDAQMGVQNSITFAFMNTPMEVCRERIMARNGGLGPTGKGINDEATVVHQWSRVRQIRDRLTEKHETCYTLDWQNSYAQVVTLLQTIGGWDPMSTPPVTHPQVRTRYSLQDVWNELASGTYPDDDLERIKRFQAEMEKHKEKFPS
jgi:hypothetical protein